MFESVLSLEGAVISGIVLEGETCLPIAFELNVDENVFTDRAFKITFEIVSKLYDENKAIPDEIMVMDEMMSHSQWSNKLQYAWQDIQKGESFIHFKHYCEKLVDRAYKRLIREAYLPLKSIAEGTTDEDMDKYQTRHKELLGDAERYNRSNQSKTAIYCQELREEADRSVKGEAAIANCRMDHLEGFDEIMTPIEKREMVTIAARPSDGKTSMGTGICAENLKSEYNKQIAYFPLESDEKEIIRQMSAQQARVNFRKLDEYEKNKVDRYYEMIDRFEKISGERFHVCGEKHLTRMTRWLDGLSAKGNKPDIIIVDYLQRVRAGSPRENRTTQVGYISRELKDWAKDFDCTVIALAQLKRRDPKAKADRLPSMDDLRESGDIEADSNRILLIHQWIKDNDGVVKRVKFIQDKQRFGPKSSMNIKFHTELTRFYVPKSEQERTEEENW